MDGWDRGSKAQRSWSWEAGSPEGAGTAGKGQDYSTGRPAGTKWGHIVAVSWEGRSHSRGWGNRMGWGNIRGITGITAGKGTLWLRGGVTAGTRSLVVGGAQEIAHSHCVGMESCDKGGAVSQRGRSGPESRENSKGEELSVRFLGGGRGRSHPGGSGASVRAGGGAAISSHCSHIYQLAPPSLRPLRSQLPM